MHRTTVTFIVASFGLLVRASYRSVSAYLAISNHIPEEISGHEEAFRFTPLRTRAPYPSNLQSKIDIKRRNQTSRQRDPGSVPSTNSVTLFYIERGSCTVQFQFQFRLIKLHWDSVTFNDSIDLLLSLYYRRVNIIYGKKKLQYNDSIGYSYIVFTKFFSFVPYNVCACNIQ